MGCIGSMGDSESTTSLKFSQYSPPGSDFFEVNDLINSPESDPSYGSNHIFIPNQTSSCSESELSPEAPDFSDACLKYLSDILMGNLDDNPSTVQDYIALHATEKSLYEAIGESYSLPTVEIPDDGGNAYSGSETTTFESSQVIQSPSLPREASSPSAGSSASGADDVTVGIGTSSFSSVVSPEVVQGNLDWIQKALSSFTHLGNPEGYGLMDSSRGFEEKSGRKTHQRDERDDGEDGRGSKHLAAYVEEELQMEQFDDILLGCKGGSAVKESSSPKDECTSTITTVQQQPKEKAKRSKGKGSSRKKKQSNNEDVVDLNPLLTQCAQAVATFDIRGTNELLKRIRQHSSPHGDGIQRVAHYFAEGLEARLAGNASQLYSDFINWQISLPSFLHAYRSYVSSVPFKRTSFFLANKTINKITAGAKRVHVIDFGIFNGIQWPCLIQLLSQRPNPPVLRLTAVDFPERGYQPAAKIEQTLRRLEVYCKRFGVTFEHVAIAQRWDTLQPEDFKLRGDEVLVVNCLYRAKALLDDTVDTDSPRDTFLKLVTKLKPDLFIHGIVNGTYNAPFFTTRFKEALFHYSSMFDMFEATMGREDEERKWIEKGLYGRDILNVVACEGSERVERPETYKQWQVRNQRAGLRQVPLDREILGKAKAMVRSNYHKDFVVDEDNNWMLQGWKGRLLYALSCWKPA